MIVKLTLVQGAGLMGCVAGLAAHVECGVTAAFLRYLRALRVAGQAEVVVLGGAGNVIEQLVLVFRSVRIVAGQAVADRWLVHLTLDLGGVFVSVTGEAKPIRRGCDQLDAGRSLVDPYFGAAQAG